MLSMITKDKLIYVLPLSLLVSYCPSSGSLRRVFWIISKWSSFPPYFSACNVDDNVALIWMYSCVCFLLLDSVSSFLKQTALSNDCISCALFSRSSPKNSLSSSGTSFVMLCTGTDLCGTDSCFCWHVRQTLRSPTSTLIIPYNPVCRQPLRHLTQLPQRVAHTPGFLQGLVELPVEELSRGTLFYFVALFYLHKLAFCRNFCRF